MRNSLIHMTCTGAATALLCAGSAWSQQSTANSAVQRVGVAAPAPAAAAATPTAPTANAQSSGAKAAVTPLPAAGIGGAPMPAPLPAGQVAVAPLNLVNDAINQVAPLTPQEVLDLRGELARRSAAMSQPLDPVGKPVQRSVTIAVGPGAAPEVLRPSVSQGSIVSFMDAGGRPWPVEGADNFNPSQFNVAQFGVAGLSVAVKRGATSSAVGNIAVKLEGLDHPVVLSLAPNQREVDFALEVQVPKFRPGLPTPVGAAEQVKSLGASDLLDFLLNTPPKSARVLTTNVRSMAAWQISPERMIVRTDGTLSSPAWTRRQSSLAGVTVYEVPLTPVVVYATEGQIATARIDGFVATKEQKQ